MAAEPPSPGCGDVDKCYHIGQSTLTESVSNEGHLPVSGPYFLSPCGSSDTPLNGTHSRTQVFRSW